MKEKLKKLGSYVHKGIVWYLVLYAPVFIVAAALFNYPESEPANQGLAGLFNELGFVWILSVIYAVAAFVVSRRMRESLMTRLAGFQERDEREELVSASAARASFLLMLAVQIVAFVMTLTKIGLTWDPLAQGPKGLLTVGLGVHPEHWQLFGDAANAATALAPAQWQWNHYLLPPNLAPILLVLILLQLAGYRIFSRISTGRLDLTAD